jgi:hypothetical protein
LKFLKSHAGWVLLDSELRGWSVGDLINPAKKARFTSKLV